MGPDVVSPSCSSDKEHLQEMNLEKARERETVWMMMMRLTVGAVVRGWSAVFLALF